MISDPQGSVDRDTPSKGMPLSRLRGASLASSSSTLSMARRRSASLHGKRGHHYHGESADQEPLGASTTNSVTNVMGG